ncbi:MAG: class I SAM-dependent methyltransferase [Flavobacteriales bacterium]|nr:class I SAM-dependent methyltransferase [Flavobacteriales bacterium]
MKLERIKKYYENKLDQYGPSPKGVDWNSIDAQLERFKILSNLLTTEEDFSCLDYGCGYGGLLDFLVSCKHNLSQYTGYDISKQMIKIARKRYQNTPSVKVHWKTEINDTKYDYVIASGLFNVKLSNSIEDWEKYIEQTISQFNSLSIKGFAFNCLTSYSDQEYMKDYLFYANPLKIFDHCKINYSRNVGLLHDYDLYEFTIIVRK